MLHSWYPREADKDLWFLVGTSNEKKKASSSIPVTKVHLRLLSFSVQQRHNTSISCSKNVKHEWQTCFLTHPHTCACMPRLGSSSQTPVLKDTHLSPTISAFAGGRCVEVMTIPWKVEMTNLQTRVLSLAAIHDGSMICALQIQVQHAS